MVRARMVIQRGSYDDDASESEEEGNGVANDSDASSDPALPSDDDDSDYGKPKKRSSKKKSASKKSSASGKKKKATPRGKISPAKTPNSRKRKSYVYHSEDEEEEDEEEQAPAKKRGKKSAKRSIDFEQYAGRSPGKGKKGGGKGGAGRPKKAATPASSGRSSGRSPAKRPKYTEPDSDDDEVEEVIDDSEDYEEPVPKKKAASSKKGSAAKGRGRPKKSAASGKKQKNKASKYYDPSESEGEEEEESEDEARYKPKKGRYLSAKQMKAPKPKLPPVSEMVIDSIKALKENPRKGSSLRDIRETIEMNWTVDWGKLCDKVKKYILNAEATGEIIRVKGTKNKKERKGFNGRFTVPGLKPKKKKKKEKLTKQWDEDQEPEYKPPEETERTKSKEAAEAELERQREERRLEEERKAVQKELQPKAPPRPKKVDYEVEKIVGDKETKDGDVKYLVKWVGYTKPTWEDEANVEECQDLIDAYFIVKEKKEKEKEERLKERENGDYEVAKIVDVEIDAKTGSREFLVRWKGWGPGDDTWEPEDNLDCPEIIEKFMDKWEETEAIRENRSLRMEPKKIDRLDNSEVGTKRTKSRKINRGQTSYRINYGEMDEGLNDCDKEDVWKPHKARVFQKFVC